MSDQLLIGVDVDEVVADLISEWLRRYNVKWNDTLKPEDIHGWAISDFVKPECGKAIYHLLSERDFYETVKPIPGSLEAIKELRTLGRVIFVTSCARNTMDSKFSWLVRYGFLRPNEVFNFIAAKDKWLVGVDVLFDDGVHNVEAFKGHAYLVGHYHNLHTTCTRERISSLAAVPEKVRQMIATR